MYIVSEVLTDAKNMLFTALEAALHAADHIEKASPLLSSPQDHSATITP
jgi:hypothetical protein